MITTESCKGCIHEAIKIYGSGGYLNIPVMPDYVEMRELK